MAVVLKLSGGEAIELTEEAFVIGREVDSDMTLADDDEVSRHHASIRLLDDGRAELRDLDSRNGTFVDGKQIEGTVTLNGGETITIGRTEIATEAVRPPAAETVVSSSPPPPPPTKAGAPPPSPPEAVAPTEVPPPQEPPPTEAVPGPPPTEAVPTPPAQEPPPTEAVPTPPPPPPPPPAVRQQAPQFDAPPPAPQPKKSGGRRWIWLAIVGAILLVVVLAAIWFFLIRESDEDAITSTIEKFAAGDPEACDLVTDDLLEEQAPDSSPDEARAECKSQIEPSDGSFEISNLQITGNRASATVTGVGGENDGQVEDAVLINEDGEWKIDSYEAVTD